MGKNDPGSVGGPVASETKIQLVDAPEMGEAELVAGVSPRVGVAILILLFVAGLVFLGFGVLEYSAKEGGVEFLVVALIGAGMILGCLGSIKRVDWRDIMVNSSGVFIRDDLVGKVPFIFIPWNKVQDYGEKKGEFWDQQVIYVAIVFKGLCGAEVDLLEKSRFFFDSYGIEGEGAFVLPTGLRSINRSLTIMYKNDVRK